MVVGDRGFAGEIDGDGVLGLHVVEAGEDQAQNLLGVGTHLGDGLGGAAVRRPERVQMWTGAFPFAAAHRARVGRVITKIGTAG